jgi:hypothetical protein
MFGLSFNRPSPDQLQKDEYHWTLSEDQRQERLAELRAHVRDLRTEQPQWETVYEPTPTPTPRLFPRQPESPTGPSVPWTSEPPLTAGLYWWRWRGLDARLQHAAQPRLCSVVDFGGHLSVLARGADSSKYITVAALARDWAGPVPIPEGVKLEDLRIVEPTMGPWTAEDC